MKPKMDWWIYIDDNPFNTTQSTNFEDKIKAGVKEYTTMIISTLNYYVKLNIKKLWGTVSLMATEAS